KVGRDGCVIERLIGEAVEGAVRVVGGAEKVIPPRLPKLPPPPTRASACVASANAATAASTIVKTRKRPMADPSSPRCRERLQYGALAPPCKGGSCRAPISRQNQQKPRTPRICRDFAPGLPSAIRNRGCAIPIDLSRRAKGPRQEVGHEESLKRTGRDIRGGRNDDRHRQAGRGLLLVHPGDHRRRRGRSRHRRRDEQSAARPTANGLCGARADRVFGRHLYAAHRASARHLPHRARAGERWIQEGESLRLTGIRRQTTEETRPTSVPC